MATNKAEQTVNGYLDLISRRSDLFPMIENIVTDRETLIRYSEANDKVVGLVYESPWHYLIVDVVKQPDGTPGYAYERYVSCSTNPGSVAIPILPDGKICLLKNYRHMLGKEVYELPRGGGFNGEDQISTAARELAEELGAKAITSHLLGHVIADSGINGDRVGVVRIDIERTDVQIGHEGISGHVEWSIDEIYRKIAEGAIEDAFTLSAMTLLHSS